MVAHEFVVENFPLSRFLSPMPQLLKRAATFGAAPLLIGAAIYEAWRVTRWPGLEIAGLFTIFIGLVTVLAGAIALERHLRQELASRGALGWQGWLVGGLLFLNFPAAAWFTFDAIDISTRYTIRIDNDSDQPIDSVMVTGPGVRVEMGPIAAGQHTRRRLSFSGDGRLEFSARQQELSLKGEVEGYVTGGSTGDKRIRIRQRGVYEIRSDS